MLACRFPSAALRTVSAGLMLCAAVATMLATRPAAAVPTVLTVEGVLQSAAGQPAPDGDYGLTFQLYGAQTGGAAVWKDGPLMVAVKGGQFALSIGQNQPLTAAILASVPQPWLGVTVGTGDELPRRPLQSVAFALRATTAEGVDCSGCIGLAQLDPAVLQPYAKTADLASLAKSADLAAYAKSEELNSYAKIATLAAVAGSGAYADLSGKPVLAPVATSGVYQDLEGLPKLAKLGTACGSGLVVRGLLGDGSLDCVSAAITAANLPADGLAQVSNGLLLNKFDEVTVSGKTPLDIADKAVTSDAINVPDYGKVDGLSVSIDLVNSDISKLRIVLQDPQGGSYTLHDQSGSGTSLKTAWPAPSATVAGDLAVWKGANPAGVWTIEVTDLAGVGGKADGKLNSWSISATALSSKKVQAQGGLQFFNAASDPLPCTAQQAGLTYYNTVAKALYICNGTQYYPLTLAPYGTQQNPAASCNDLLVKAPGSKDGQYYIVLNGATVQVTCDMTADGGGWTLLESEGTGSNATAIASGWSDGTLTNASVAGSATLVHGVWGAGGGAAKTYSAPPHTQMRVAGRYYAIDSWDNEPNGAQLLVDGSLKWSASKQYSQAGQGGGWVGASFSPAPWGGGAQNGYWSLAAAVGGNGVINHGGNNLKLEFRTGIDQDKSDESFAFSHIQLWVK